MEEQALMITVGIALPHIEETGKFSFILKFEERIGEHHACCADLFR
jgi:hypothetical protein